MRVTKAMLVAAQAAEMEYLAANRAEFMDHAGLPLTSPDLIRAMLQAAYAVAFPPQRGRRREQPHVR